jgi:hypothetical protein
MDVYLADKDGDKKDGGGNGQTGVITRTQSKTKKPSLYKVLLLNDDYTPMEFVVHVLERFFGKGREEATRYHVACAPEGRRGVRCLHLRNRRNESDTGHGFCPSAFSIRCSAPWKRNRSRPVPTFSGSLEQALHRALALASERSHEYATLEHLAAGADRRQGRCGGDARVQRRYRTAARQPGELCRSRNWPA